MPDDHWGQPWGRPRDLALGGQGTPRSPHSLLAVLMAMSGEPAGAWQNCLAELGAALRLVPNLDRSCSATEIGRCRVWSRQTLLGKAV